jgi:hypothetical protein
MCLAKYSDVLNTAEKPEIQPSLQAPTAIDDIIEIMPCLFSKSDSENKTQLRSHSVLIFPKHDHFFSRTVAVAVA